ncbi:hypothetical protein [Caballeronia glathei]|jgi:hypothetical protein|uniref:hypothetical protein n=1 Tax=Caballeronia glathei TaxID=60547 RepID=UPI001ABB72D3|nr:hypothetical protein [Caballeronia glathei]
MAFSWNCMDRLDACCRTARGAECLLSRRALYAESGVDAFERQGVSGLCRENPENARWCIKATRRYIAKQKSGAARERDDDAIAVAAVFSLPRGTGAPLRGRTAAQ